MNESTKIIAAKKIAKMPEERVLKLLIFMAGMEAGEAIKNSGMEAGKTITEKELERAAGQGGGGIDEEN